MQENHQNGNKLKTPSKMCTGVWKMIVRASTCIQKLAASIKPHHNSLMILPQVHLRKPCYDFYFL